MTVSIKILRAPGATGNNWPDDRLFKLCPAAVRDPVVAVGPTAVARGPTAAARGSTAAARGSILDLSLLTLAAASVWCPPSGSEATKLY